MSFQIHALAPAGFEPLFTMSDADLAEISARRMTVDSKPGYPCRVSLADAEVGETVILVNFTHLSADSPYRSAHAIYVREHARQVFPEIDEVPELFHNRTISVRAFDGENNMVDAELVGGARVAESITTMLQNTSVSYLHLHNAQRGCFLARATRA